MAARRRRPVVVMQLGLGAFRLPSSLGPDPFLKRYLR